MDSTPSRREQIKTALVMATCMSTAALGGYLLDRDIASAGGQGIGPPMARIERRESRVRHKFFKSFVWRNAEPDETLYRRDWVRTAVGSAASIRFNDGTLLELGESSMVLIEDLEKLSLDFVKGSVVMHTATGDKHLTTGRDGKARLEELPVRLLKPEPLARFVAPTRESAPIRFVWSARQGQEIAPGEVFLEISRERSFKAGVLRIQRTGSAGHASEAQVPLREGTYYWRLTSGAQPVTEVSQFQIVAADPVLPASSVWAGAGRQPASDAAEDSAQFRWLVPQNSEPLLQAEHELQVARDPEFNKIVHRKRVDVTGGSAILRAIPRDGKLWWRIVSRYGDSEIKGPSQDLGQSRELRAPAFAFAVEKPKKPVVALAVPAAGAIVEQPARIRLLWRSDTRGLKYLVEIKDSSGKSVLSQKVSARSLDWQDPAVGSYQWRVTALSDDNGAVATPWRRLEIFEIPIHSIVVLPGIATRDERSARPLTDYYRAYRFRWREEDLPTEDAGPILKFKGLYPLLRRPASQ